MISTNTSIPPVSDSIIYISREGDYDVPTGSGLGLMENELRVYGNNSFIEEFTSGGPKNYAFKVWSTNIQDYVTVCKVKGICLNYIASTRINFDTMKDMIQAKQQDPVAITSKQIRITDRCDVITKEETKIYRLRSEKRKFTDDYDSYPYGYKRLKN